MNNLFATIRVIKTHLLMVVGFVFKMDYRWTLITPNGVMLMENDNECWGGERNA